MYRTTLPPAAYAPALASTLPNRPYVCSNRPCTNCLTIRYVPLWADHICAAMEKYKLPGGRLTVLTSDLR